MERFFNTAGPMVPRLNYCIDPLTRIDWEDVQRLIGNERYFIMHAPRQTGKTSALMAMMRTLNEEGRYACAYSNIEIAQPSRGDFTLGLPAVCGAVSSSLKYHLKRADLRKWFLEECMKMPPQEQLFEQIGRASCRERV